MSDVVLQCSVAEDVIVSSDEKFQLNVVFTRIRMYVIYIVCADHYSPCIHCLQSVLRLLELS